MTKERKTPQQKKQLEYTKDHFTFGWNSSRLFPKVWKRKKAHANRSYRNKSEQLLAQAKPGITSEDAEWVADDLTATHFQKSVSRRRLRKTGTVTVGEKVGQKLKAREEAIGRTKARRRYSDSAAVSAVSVLCSLKGAELVRVVRRADLTGRGRVEELERLRWSDNAVDRATNFLYLVSRGVNFEVNTLRRNPELARTFQAWMEKARYILERDEQARQRMLRLGQKGRKKLKEVRKKADL